jgi:hypothetical protein
MLNSSGRRVHAASPTPGSPGRARRTRATVTTVAVIGALGLTAPAAFAVHYQDSLEGSYFEIDTDANFTLDSPAPPDPADPTFKDWNTVSESRQNDAATGQGDNSYKGGVKEDTTCPAETTGSIPNNKSDLKTFGVWVEPGSATDDPGYLHMFWTRVSDPSGTTLMDFEFNQSKTGCTTGPNKLRTEGDLLFEYSIDQGGARADITLRMWDGSAWGTAEAIGASEATGTINQSTILAGDTGGVSTEDLQARTFGEASVDLDVIFDKKKCTSFGSAMLKSRSSDSFTSQLKDFIAPLPIDLTNCGKVVIHKETDPDEAGVDFDFSKTFGTDPTTLDTFKLNDKTNDTITFSNVLFGTGYTVSEGTTPTGWDFDKVDCSASKNVTPVVSGSTVTFDIDSTSDVLECTYYNKARAKLTIVKKVDDAPGGTSFGFTTTGTGLSNFSLTPTAVGDAGADQKVFSDLAPGSYSVSETEPAGWNLKSATCDNSQTPGSLTLGAGDNVTCTFVNERERGAILITKSRKHAAATNGEGPHAGVDFTITGGGLPAEGAALTTDANGKACLDGLLYGDFTVTESVPTGYVSDDEEQTVTVDTEATCAGPDTDKASVTFVNTPLTDVTVSVDSQVDGGTASTIVCVDAGDNVVVQDITNAPGDVQVTAQDLLPTAPGATLVCTITVDP